MSVLVLGKNGQLGRAFAQCFAGEEAIFWGRDELDLTNQQDFERKIIHAKPSVIINAAAYTAVDLAESQAKMADQINHLAVEKLAHCAALIDARLVHFSTDYVFDGRQDTPYLETDLPNPLGVYGASKLAGERAIQESGCKHLIFRTSWVVSEDGHNFIKTILRLSGERDALRVVDDQIGAPTSAAFIARTSRAALAAGLEDGLYHLTCSGETSWHGLARHVVTLAAQYGMVLSTSPEAIEAIQTADYPTAARRPKSSRLDCNKLFNRLKVEQASWQETTEQIIRHFNAAEKIT